MHECLWMNGQMKIDINIERHQSINKTVESTIPKKLNLTFAKMAFLNKTIS